MRSHMMSLPIPPKLEEEDPPPPPPPETSPAPAELSEEADSASSSSSEEAGEREEEEGEDEKELYYGLRENPKRSIKLVDPEFSFAVVDAGSVVLQDRESETESSKNPTRRRSKRTRKSASNSSDHHHQYWQFDKTQLSVQDSSFANTNKKLKSSELSEPVSSVSDTTTDEDIAFCLMMLSRDNWNRENEELEEAEGEGEEEDHAEEEDEDESENESEEQLKSSRNTNTRTRGKYKCETCSKVFRSYQALGGHRASHKKIKISSSPALEEIHESLRENAGSVITKKIHECPVCFRVFSSGQALGGHKRSHVLSATITSTISAPSPPKPTSAKNPSFSTTTTTKKSLNKLGDQISLIDLNLPAPDDDGGDDDDDDEDEISQIEFSAVSDAEFVNHIR